MVLECEREQVVDYSRKMLAAGLTAGTGGNISLLNAGQQLVAITPSGIPYPEMTPGDVVVMDLSGRMVDGERKPSSEAGFHLALYHHRPAVRAVVHTHSVYATTFACLNREIAPVHYLVGFSGDRVPLAPYATYGTPALAENIVRHIGSYNAVLLANHGLVAVGKDLASALNTAEEIEFVARVYYQALTIGAPCVLSRSQMDEVMEKFKDYGPKQP